MQKNKTPKFRRAGLIALSGLALVLGGVVAEAAISRQPLDIKLPTQHVLERQVIVAPSASVGTVLATATGGNTSAAAVVLTTFTAQPDVPRNITILAGTSTGDVAACDIVVAGTNFYGESITDTLTFTANLNTRIDGAKAFKTVTSVTFPASCEDAPYAATWNIGTGEKLGLKNCLDYEGDFISSSVGGTFESTRASCTADADEVEKNVCDFNGTMNGANTFRAFFVQNFRCHP